MIWQEEKYLFVFVDLKKAYDHAPRKAIWWELRKDVIKKDIFAIKEMHASIVRSVKIDSYRSKKF